MEHWVVQMIICVTIDILPRSLMVEDLDLALILDETLVDKIIIILVCLAIFFNYQVYLPTFSKFGIIVL